MLHKLSIRAKIAVCLVGFATGIYLLSLFFAPNLITTLKPHSQINIASLKNDHSDRLIIPSIKVEVPYSKGGAAVLNKGAWHRFPERGNPEKGGNFILSGHRFVRGWTPQSTAKRSYFFFLDKLKSGDKIYIMYHQQLYEYQVVKTYRVTPYSVEIEAPTKEAQLTLYTCTLGGSFDGRVVVVAKPAKDGTP